MRIRHLRLQCCRRRVTRSLRDSNGAERAIAGKEYKRVTFWGRVVDQDNAPVERAAVKICGASDLSVLTDRDGLFKVESFESNLVEVTSIAKRDYCVPPLFSPYSVWLSEQLERGVDRAKPVVFRLLRNGGEYEGLLRLERKFDLRADGKQVTIDLLTGKTSDAADAKGDFRVTVVRPVSVRKKFNNYDWSATVEAIDGGFGSFAADDKNSSWAPKDGYSPRLHWDVKAVDSPWDGVVHVRTFFRSRDGRVYGLLTSLTLSPSWSPLEEGCPIIAVKGLLNPNGSRNLQDGGATVVNVFSSLDAVLGFDPRAVRDVGEVAPETEKSGKPSSVRAEPNRAPPSRPCARFLREGHRRQE